MFVHDHAHSARVKPGRMAAYPSDVTDWRLTDLDPGLLGRAEKLGYYWDHARLESQWDISGRYQQWEHIFGYTWQTLYIKPITVPCLHEHLEDLERFYRFKAQLKDLGWQFSQHKHWEWDELIKCRNAGGDVAALVRTFQEQNVAEQERAALWKQYWKACDRAAFEVAIARSDDLPKSISDQLAELHEAIAAVKSYQGRLEAQEVERITRSIKRWAKQGLSRNEMVRRLGGDRNAALKLIGVVLHQALAK